MTVVASPPAVRISFRGTVRASAVILDPALVGVEEARRRALDLGFSELVALPDGRWLLRLVEPTDLRCERASGQPLVGDGSGFAVPGLPVVAGELSWLAGDETHRVALEGLPLVPTRDWVDLPAPVQRLQPLDEAQPPAAVPLERPAPADDLRLLLGVAPERPRRARRQGRLARPVRLEGAWRHLRLALMALGALALVAVLVGAVVAVVQALDHPASHPASATHHGTDAAAPHVPWIGIVVGLAIAARAAVAGSSSPTGSKRSKGSKRSGATGGASPGRGPGRFRRWLNRSIARPATGLVNRRQQRYLRKLTEDVERGRWQELLADGIGLGTGTGEAWFRLRLPRGRDSLRIQARTAAGSPTAMGGTAYAYLQELYRRAATELERAGAIEESTFVYAELLRDAPAAVALLEQHGRLRLAAEVAEGRDLEAGLVVRLWWRAGERDEAVRVARSRGAFAAGITRLEQVDEAAALELRHEWVRSLREAGDHLGAVRAAWPSPELRDGIGPDVEAGVALGGAEAGALLAYSVCARPDPGTTARALELLDHEQVEQRRARGAFITTLDAERVIDPSIDRHLTSAAVRSLLHTRPTQAERPVMQRLAKRADPLLRADLPPAPGRPDPGSFPPDVTAPVAVGQLPVLDAVTLGGGRVLAAHGDLGVRLWTPDGRIAARWDLVAHRLVVADHGGSVLVARRAGDLTEFHHLDLHTRRVRPWTTLSCVDHVGTFDGTVLITVDAQGLAFLDTLADRPRVLWRELDEQHRVFALNRSATRLTAMVDGPLGNGRGLQLWSWDVPGRTLRVRRTLELPFSTNAVVAGDGRLVITSDVGDGPRLTYLDGYGDPVVVPGADGTQVRADGRTVLVTRPEGDELVCEADVRTSTEPLHLRFPPGAGSVGLRERDGLVTVWDGAGRVVAVDGDTVVAAFATRV